MRTPDEIKKMLDIISRMRNSMPRYNAFGDSNWKALDVQLEILNGQLDNPMSASQMRSISYNADGDEYDAYNWLLGDTDEWYTEEEVKIWEGKKEKNEV